MYKLQRAKTTKTKERHNDKQAYSLTKVVNALVARVEQDDETGKRVLEILGKSEKVK